jgi:hypothetical protein
MAKSARKSKTAKTPANETAYTIKHLDRADVGVVHGQV